MHIRRLVPSDAAAFQALRLTALREQPLAFGSSFEEECVTPIAVIEERLHPDSERKMFGAFEEGELVGIVGVGREAAVKLRHKGFIRAMYVAVEQRGNGLGRALMEHALAFAATMEGLHQVSLGVTVGNDAAIRLYESLGFKAFGCEPDAMFIAGVFYDELHMVRLI